MPEPLAVRKVEVTSEDSPALLDDIDEYVRLDNAVCSHDSGHDDLSTMTRDEALGTFRERADRLTDLWIAERDGEVVGALTTTIVADEPVSVEFDLMVDPTDWDERVAEALLAIVDRTAVEAGLDTVQTWTLHRSDPPTRPLSPSTGIGVIDGAAPLAAFLAGSGFTLEQVERNSRFDLQGSFEGVQTLFDEALEVAGGDYRVVGFTDRCPDEYVDSLAAVVSRMSTDAPQGGTAVPVERIDAARVRRREARMAAQGLTSSTVMAVHDPTGTVAAYNELVIGRDDTGTTSQYGTLVLREHRGRSLGLLVKCAGLLRWRGVAPESPQVTTFNAEENVHMLGINVRLGFVPASYAGAWKRVTPEGAAGSAGRSGSSGS